MHCNSGRPCLRTCAVAQRICCGMGASRAPVMMTCAYVSAQAGGQTIVVDSRACISCGGAGDGRLVRLRSLQIWQGLQKCGSELDAAAGRNDLEGVPESPEAHEGLE
eukprot:12946315-Alexandrium_andersonii.AAC.1